MFRLIPVLIFGVVTGIVLASSIWPRNRSPLIYVSVRGFARGLVSIRINRNDENGHLPEPATD